MLFLKVLSFVKVVWDLETAKLSKLSRTSSMDQRTLVDSLGGQPAQKRLHDTLGLKGFIIYHFWFWLCWYYIVHRFQVNPPQLVNPINLTKAYESQHDLSPTSCDHLQSCWHKAIWALRANTLGDCSAVGGLFFAYQRLAKSYRCCRHIHEFLSIFGPSQQ